MDDSTEDLKLVLPGRGLPAGAGWDWVAGAWKLFLRAPLMWIISFVLVFIAFVAIGIVPILGGIAVQLLQPVIVAGFVAASHSLERGGNFELDHLFTGFKKSFGNLVLVGLFFMIGGFLILAVFVGIVGTTVGVGLLTGNPEEALSTIMASALAIVMGLLVMMALLVPLLAAYWFAPALVLMHDMQPLPAMRESFSACMRNFVPFLVYGIVMLFFALLAAIPFGLGYLVWVPVTMASLYVSYRQIFTEEPAPAPAKPTFA